MKVRISEQAEAELERIGDYIAQDSPLRAMTFIDELRTAALALGDWPAKFPLIPRYERYGYSSNASKYPHGHFCSIGSDFNSCRSC